VVEYFCNKEGFIFPCRFDDRFDFVCGEDACKQGRNAEEDAMLAVEDLVNQVIARDLRTNRHVTQWSTASSLPNLVTVPGEVYPEAGLVLIEVPDFSLEPCCGTHAAQTGHLDKFVVTQNKSVQAGVRSVKFVTGLWAKKVEENDEAFEAKLREVLGDLAAEGVSPESVDAVKAFDALRRARKELAAAELISYRKRRRMQTILDSRADVVRRAAKKQIVSMVRSREQRRLVITIDYRCEDGRFPLSPSCVAISYDDSLSISEIEVNSGIKS
jgi:alanyl-tRNA synthetase